MINHDQNCHAKDCILMLSLYRNCDTSISLAPRYCFSCEGLAAPLHGTEFRKGWCRKLFQPLVFPYLQCLTPWYPGFWWGLAQVISRHGWYVKDDHGGFGDPCIHREVANWPLFKTSTPLVNLPKERTETVPPRYEAPQEFLHNLVVMQGSQVHHGFLWSITRLCLYIQVEVGSLYLLSLDEQLRESSWVWQKPPWLTNHQPTTKHQT